MTRIPHDIQKALTDANAYTDAQMAGRAPADWDAEEGPTMVVNKPSSMPASAHDHDDRYYTKAEVNAKLPALWENTTDKGRVITLVTSATSSGSSVTFNLTQDGTAGGTALFTEVFKGSARLWVDDATMPFMYGGYTLAGNLKTVTFTVKQLSFTSAIVALVSVLIGQSTSNIPGGTTVHLQITGK